VGLLDQFIDPILNRIWDRIKVVFAPFTKLFNFVQHFYTEVKTIFSRVDTLVKLIVGEVDAWKGFRENLAFRTKLISVPKALDHIDDLIQLVRDAWASVQDIIRLTKEKFNAPNPTEEAEEALADIENSGFKGIFEKFPRLLKGAEKILGAAAIILDAIQSISAGIDDLTKIVEAEKQIREAVEEGKGFFLSQSNPRKSIPLAEGGSIKIRVGNLHS
jgi:hypothetical protein